MNRSPAFLGIVVNWNDEKRRKKAFQKVKAFEKMTLLNGLFKAQSLFMTKNGHSAYSPRICCTFQDLVHHRCLPER